MLVVRPTITLSGMTGKACVLFWKTATFDQEHTKNREYVWPNTQARLRTHYSVRQIAKQDSVSANAVWKRIVRAYKNDDITVQELRDILMKNLDTPVRDSLIVELERTRRENIRLQERARLTRIDRKITLPKAELERKFKEAYGKDIPLAMLEATSLYLDTLYDQ